MILLVYKHILETINECMITSQFKSIDYLTLLVCILTNYVLTKVSFLPKIAHQIIAYTLLQCFRSFPNGIIEGILDTLPMSIIQIIATLLILRLFFHINILLNFQHAYKLQLPLLYLFFVVDTLFYVTLHIDNIIQIIKQKYSQKGIGTPLIVSDSA